MKKYSKLSAVVLSVALTLSYVGSVSAEEKTVYYQPWTNSGTIIESKPGSRVGGTVTPVDPYTIRPFTRVGDDAKNRQTVGIYSFDTSEIPDDAHVTHAEVSFPFDKKTYVTSLGAVVMDVRNRPFGQSEALEAEDFQAEATYPDVKLSRVDPFSDGWGKYIGAVIPSDQRKVAINKMGPTQIRVRSTKRTNGNETAEFYRITVGAPHASYSAAPILKVTYTTAD